MSRPTFWEVSNAAGGSELRGVWVRIFGERPFPKTSVAKVRATLKEELTRLAAAETAEAGFAEKPAASCGDAAADAEKPAAKAEKPAEKAEKPAEKAAAKSEKAAAKSEKAAEKSEKAAEKPKAAEKLAAKSEKPAKAEAGGIGAFFQVEIRRGGWRARDLLEAGQSRHPGSKASIKDVYWHRWHLIHELGESPPPWEKAAPRGGKL